MACVNSGGSGDDTMIKISQASIAQQVESYEAVHQEIAQIKEWIAKYTQQSNRLEQLKKIELLESAHKAKASQFQYCKNIHAQ